MPDRAFKQGNTLPLKLRLYCGTTELTDTAVPAPQIFQLWRSGEEVPLTLLDLDSGASNDDGYIFRYSDGTWIYNLSTRNLTTGSYIVTILMPDGNRYHASFVLR
jgi:hypothetical protein